MTAPRLFFAVFVAVGILAGWPVPATAQQGNLLGQPWPEVGGWGQAWGDEQIPAAQPATAPIRQILAPPPAPAAAQPAVVAQAAPAASSPQAAPADGAAPTAGTGKKKKKNGGDAESEAVQLTADQIIHDRDLDIVSAVGRVEITQNGRTMIADNVSYALKKDMISARGNVVLLEPSGEVVFADYFDLSGDFKDGVAREIRVLLTDRSRLAAASAVRVGGTRTDFDRAAYTACEPCREHPERTPLWQAKAERVTHNEDDHSIEYRDAWLEVAGVPVAYTPYLSHPDPTVKRKSGFLTPSVGMSSNLGFNATVPYFWVMNDQEDFTFSPRFLFPKASKTSNDLSDIEHIDQTILQRMVLAGEHRYRGRVGESRTIASLTEDKTTAKLRGHIDAEGRFDLSETWRAGYKVERSSDDTYTSLYHYPINSSRPWMTTRPYLEGFGRRSYGMAEAYSFQGVRSTDDPGQSPLVLPHLTYSHVTTPSRLGGHWNFDTDFLAYTRAEGTDSARLSTQAAWQIPITTRMGDTYTVTTSLRADGYHSDDMPNNLSGTTGRVVPQVALNWRYPFVNDSVNLPQVIEPLAMLAASPNGGNGNRIPNEDSIDFELDDTNVLRANRLPGLDRVEGGVRGGYGLRWAAYPRVGGSVAGQVAQGWRLHDDSTFAGNSGFGDQLSDYVGRLSVNPNGSLNLTARVRLDKDTLDLRRNETSITVGPPAFRLGANYIYFDGNPDLDSSIYGRRQQITYSVSSALTRYWSAQATATNDLNDGGGPLGWTGRLTYNDECLAFITNMRRFYTHDRDFAAGYELMFNVVFKTLGDVPFNVF
ncbi:MAG: LPS-assembly protein LptD [Magnetospirillum sp.]|nr:LPS-assembly protein LptD [Magnetospirillum sp.]